MFKPVAFEVEGVVPLLMNNGATANPMNEYAKEKKKINAKHKKTEDDYKELQRLEFFGGLYLNEEQKPILPAEGVEAFFYDAAKKFKLGKKSKSAVFCQEDALLKYDGPKRVEKRYQKGCFTYNSVCIKNQRVMRTHPRFDNWSCTFTLWYNPDLMGRSQVENIVKTGGSETGWFEWRPKYGRFKVTNITNGSGA